MTTPAHDLDAGPGGHLTGRTIGDFVVGRRLGRGGMGEVYLARQVSLDRPVALKVLPPDSEPDPLTLARFEAEALAAARLNHPNIVHIYAVGADQGIRYIAMEFVPGRNLRDLLRREGPPTIPMAVEIMRQAARALAAASAAGLVHRDIKPDNLLLTPDGQVKVADFGLCVRPDSAAPLTRTGVTPGTPMYMSPEQVQGRTLDHRSDLYSLGVSFYHLLAGRPPFRAENPVALALKHTHEAPPSLQQLRPEAPPSLVTLVMRLLEKDPENRPSDAAEVVRALDRVSDNLGPATRLLPTDDSFTEQSSRPSLLALPVTTTSAVTTPRARLTPTRRWYLVAVPLALALGFLASRLVGRPPARDTAPSSTSPSLPGLWMEPWLELPALPNARAQYRYAQTRTPAARRLAAWLAVPGRFPDDAETVDLAYLQLIRDLFARGDSDRLERLAAELAADQSRPDGDSWLALSRLARAAAAARRDDIPGILEPFRSWTNLELMDPAQAALALEIVVAARRTPAAADTNAAPLKRLTSQLLIPLALDGPLTRPLADRLDAAP